jgi:5-methylcytosine-specific restriction endonuclease McrA
MEEQKKWQGSKWIRPERRAAIYERDGWECVYCGRGPRDRRSIRQAHVVLTLDHLDPRSNGGNNETQNLVTACKSCNSSRQDRPWRDYASGGAQERIEWLIQQPLDIELGKAIIASLEGDVIEEAR